jgi:hypothetical protein
LGASAAKAAVSSVIATDADMQQVQVNP